MPTAGVDAANRLRAEQVLQARAQWLETWARPQASLAPHVRDALAMIHEELSAMSSVEALVWLEDPVVFHNLVSNEPGRALALMAALVGAPRKQSFLADLPVEAFIEGRLLLPRLGMLLDSGGGTVAVASSAQRVVLTWADGNQATIPLEGLPRPARLTSHLTTLPRVHQLTVLNGTPDLCGAEHALTEVDGRSLHTLGDGLSLLREVWPAAAAASQRILRGVVVLRHQSDHFFSYTDSSWHGVLFASCRDPVQVANSVVHETAHARLSPLLHLGPLLVDDGAAIHPSPWRSDPRPLHGLLNGVHAFTSVCEFYRRLLQYSGARAVSHSELQGVLSREVDRVHEAWRYIQRHAEPTPLGRPLFDALDTAIRNPSSLGAPASATGVVLA